ncbi:hypothetical protein AWC11_22210 [Mycobacterium interjectum]|nr:hypothetical protein AWC11_22210 [Mycobacterium interjectum]
MPLEPGLRRGSSVTDGPDASAPFWFAGWCPAGSPAGSVVAMALASFVLGDATAPARPRGSTAGAALASSVGGR